jgi:predicted GNAT family acetyltransferase
MDLKLKKASNGYYVGDSAQEAVARITYVTKEPDIIIIDHTFVDPSLRGQGIALKLVDEMVMFARNHKKKIIPVCSYAVKVLERDPKYNDVLLRDHGIEDLPAEVCIIPPKKK